MCKKEKKLLCKSLILFICFTHAPTNYSLISPVCYLQMPSFCPVISLCYFLTKDMEAMLSYDGHILKVIC